MQTRRTAKYLAFGAVLAIASGYSPWAAPRIALAAGVPYHVGDVFVGTTGGSVLHFAPNGHLVDTLNTTLGNAFDTGMCFDTAGNLYTTNFGANSVSKFDNAGNLQGIWASGLNSDPESCVVDTSGDIFVGRADGTHELDKLNPAGHLITSFNPSTEDRGTDWNDLAADQCTMFYTSEADSIKRFDVCANHQDSDFATGLHGPCYALRILSNRDVLVACTSQAYLLDKSGTVIRTYPASSYGEDFFFALNLDPDHASFWTAGSDTGDVVKIDIASGTQLLKFNASPNGVFGIALFGEPTAALSTSLTYDGDVAQDFDDSTTLSATLKDTDGNPISGATVSFTLGVAQGCTGTTDQFGRAACSVLVTQHPGAVTVTASFAGDPGHLPATVTVPFTINKEETALVYTGDNGADFNDPANVSATLTEDGVTPLPGRTLVFTLDGTETCTAVTGVDGSAACTLTPQETTGTYALVVNFAGDTDYQSKSTTVGFGVNLEEDSLSSSSALQVIAQNGAATFSATLREDGVTGIKGESVTITLGDGPAAQSCTGTTDASGTATCTISSVTVGLGPQTITDSFSSDGRYRPATNVQHALVFAFAPSGAFTLGDRTAASALTSGATVTWWGAQWWKDNVLSGGPAPASFKGFADNTTTPPICGGSWTTNPGNSSSPPPASSIPSYMGVIATGHVTKSGPTIAGDTQQIVVVKTNPGYQPDPGHPGTGIVVAPFCQ